MKFLRRKADVGLPGNPLTAEERFAVETVVRPGDVVFDIGPEGAAWSSEALQGQEADLHQFPIAPPVIEEDVSVLGRLLNRLRRTPPTAERSEQSARAIALDDYWSERTKQIRFLRIDAGVQGYEVLRGAGALLRQGRVDFLQIVIGPEGFGAGISPSAVHALLRRFGYRLLRVEGDTFVEEPGPGAEALEGPHWFAVHERMVNLMIGQKIGIKLEFERLAHFGVAPRGVLHVGAH